MSTSLRRTLAAAALGIATAATVSVGMGMAHAAPTPVHGPAAKKIPDATPVPGANCNYGQAKAAIAAQDPKVWAKITTDGHYRAHFQQDIMLTAQQREARDAKWRADHPVETVALQTAEKAGAFGDPVKSAAERKQFGAAVDRARANCSRF